MSIRQIIFVIAASVGLVVDIIFLFGLFFGNVKISPSTSVLSSPLFISITSFVILSYSVISIVYFIKIQVRNKWLMTGWFLTESAEETPHVTVAYLISVPPLLIWTIAIGRMMVTAQLFFSILWFSMIMFVLIFFSGQFIYAIVDSLDLLINPHLRGELNKKREKAATVRTSASKTSK